MNGTTGSRLQLSPADADQVDELASALAARYGSSADPELLAEIGLAAHLMPASIREFLHAFRLERLEGYVVLAGHPPDDGALGPTPAHWRHAVRPGAELQEEIRTLLYAAVLGEPFGWRSQQAGRIVHDVLPVRGEETTQLASGSSVQMQWHTEDAFFPFRGDYLILSCLRNPDGVATTVGQVDVSLIPERDLEVLFAERFEFVVDGSHSPAPDSDLVPSPVPLLFGARESPYVRVDPPFMKEPADEEAARALAALARAIDARLVDVALHPGELLILDNFRSVHGRRSFAARYDTTDRWLKRVNVTRDLKRSRAHRADGASHVILV